MTVSLQKVLIFAGLLIGVCFLLTMFSPCLVHDTHLYAQDAEINIDNTESYPSKSRPAVYFSHETHMEAYECLDCHHDYRDGNNILSEEALDEDGSAGCAQCHADDTAIELITAYHRQCMGCHRRINKQEQASLPITCEDCHNRRSAYPDITITSPK